MAGWTKADRAKFLERCDSRKNIMPQEVISTQGSLFDDVIETDSVNTRYQKLRLVLLYPELDTNEKGNPIPKQSARFMVTRYSNGPKKREILMYTNKHTGKPDVLIKSYQDARITNTVKALQLQVLKQLGEISFTKFRGAIFVTRLEFIFKVPNSSPKYMKDDLAAGTKIYFKDTAPDLDNLEKMVWDAMQAEKAEKDVKNALVGLVYDNDAQIVSKNGIFKRWGLRPGLILELEGPI